MWWDLSRIITFRTVPPFPSCPPLPSSLPSHPSLPPPPPSTLPPLPFPFPSRYLTLRSLPGNYPPSLKMQKLTLFLAFFTVLSLCYYYYQLILSKGSFYSCLHNFYSYPTLLLSPFFLFLHHYYYFLLQLCINSFLKYFLFFPYIIFIPPLHNFYSFPSLLLFFPCTGITYHSPIWLYS